MHVILDSQYEKGDLNKVMKNQCQNLTEVKCNELLKLLQKIEELFDETLVTWTTYLVDPELKEDAKVICLIPYPVPKVNEDMLKKEV